MIAGDSVMLAIAAVLAVVSWRWGTPLALLAATRLIIGTVDAFYCRRRGRCPASWSATSAAQGVGAEPGEQRARVDGRRARSAVRWSRLAGFAAASAADRSASLRSWPR